MERQGFPEVRTLALQRRPITPCSISETAPLSVDLQLEESTEKNTTSLVFLASFLAKNEEFGSRLNKSAGFEANRSLWWHALFHMNYKKHTEILSPCQKAIPACITCHACLNQKKCSGPNQTQEKHRKTIAGCKGFHHHV